MSTDVLILGPVVFDDFSTPEQMPFGGKQSMAVHKLLGGQRVIDTLGPDDADRTWSGFFWGPTALAQAALLDSLRISGQPVPFIWAADARTVIVHDVQIKAEKVNYVHYTVTVVTVDGGLAGDIAALGGGGSIGSAVTADISTATGLYSS